MAGFIMEMPYIMGRLDSFVLLTSEPDIDKLYNIVLNEIPGLEKGHDVYSGWFRTNGAAINVNIGFYQELETPHLRDRVKMSFEPRTYINFGSYRGETRLPEQIVMKIKNDLQDGGVHSKPLFIKRTPHIGKKR